MILDIIYNLFITPIEMVIEFIFSIIYRIANNPGVAIIGVSLVVNFLVLPLYKKSDDLSEIERNKQKEMKPWLDHIKKSFKGDERYMMTQTYYRQQGYKPIYSLRSSFSLLLQIPFFISAYHYLSNLHILNDASFLFLSNLGQPDGLLQIGSLSINILPIVMTLINVISGAIYLRGLPIRDKIQTYGIAAIFLVLLYNSPSGLVFYWTLNQIFSVCKNIVMKLLPKREKKVRKQPELIDKKVFFIAVALLTILMGLIVPLSVIKASPTEFISTNYGPIYIAIYNLSIFAGFFLVWFSIFYYLCSNRGKNIFTYIVWMLFAMCTVAFYFFGNKYGTMSPSLVYDDVPNATRPQMLLNFGVLLVVGLVFFFLLKKLPRVSKAIGTVLLLTGLVVAVVDIVNVQNTVSSVKEEKSLTNDDGSLKKILTLSKNGKNEIVFMLDRAISGYVPKILEEKPELKTQFDGFTYYPNALSFGLYTNFNTPALFGGYEYMPTEMNKRDKESLKDKNNEALKVLPVLYANNGFNSVVCDPPYAGPYEWEPDVSIYDEYENVSGYVLEGAYTNTNPEYAKYFESKQLHNFACYSIFRCFPTYFQLHFYDEGKYLTTMQQSNLDLSFLESFTAIDNLVNITEITDDGDNFLMMQNSITHQPVKLEAPDYEPKLITEGELDNVRENHYSVNIKSFMELGRWFDYLREQGAYDNTRIIISSDHGRDLAEFDYMQFNGIDVECYNPLYLVKDFNAKGFNTSDEFMTIADTAELITKDVIDSPMNPFTGKSLAHKADGTEAYYITTSELCDTYTNNGNVFDTSDRPWLEFTGNNIFDPTGWKKLDK